LKGLKRAAKRIADGLRKGEKRDRSGREVTMKTRKGMQSKIEEIEVKGP
jgi:hypothetical protein